MNKSLHLRAMLTMLVLASLGLFTSCSDDKNGDPTKGQLIQKTFALGSGDLIKNDGVDVS